mmetsp:Transcript_9309/g.18150  ORF Transcript_9309/g.18150 Transcript_9309/m.18150 type:complete len:215 (-) Transcript_9309:381-1025(-)
MGPSVCIDCACGRFPLPFILRDRRRNRFARQFVVGTLWTLRFHLRCVYTGLCCDFFVLKKCHHAAHRRTVACFLGGAPFRELRSRHGSRSVFFPKSGRTRGDNLLHHPREHRAERVHIRLEHILLALDRNSLRLRHPRSLTDLGRGEHGLKVVNAAESLLESELAACCVCDHPERGAETGDLGEAGRVEEDGLWVDVLVAHEVPMQVQKAPRTA